MYYIGGKVWWLVRKKNPLREVGNGLFAVSKKGKESPGRDRNKMMSQKKIRPSSH